nr:MAG TPA: hypothetical protein [Caudoviricetes sp.]
MRIGEPLDYLLVRFRFGCAGHDIPVRFKNIPPGSQLLIGRIIRSEVSAPPVRESLQPCTLGG